MLKSLISSQNCKIFHPNNMFMTNIILNEPVASVLALQCSTSLSYEDPYTGVFIAQAGRALQR